MMVRSASSVAIILLTFITSSCTAQLQTAAVPSSSARDSAAIDSAVAPFVAMGLSPGLAVAVVRGEEVVFLRGYGYADRESARQVTPETIFYIASTTKAFTGLAAAMLDERGVFRLDAPLSSYLPDVRLQSPLSADSITIRSLLSHTHGIGNAGPVVWRTAFTGEFTGNEQLVALLSEHPPARGGRAYEYGNIGYNVASLAMDRALGKSWKQVLEEEIFRPLGMASTCACVQRTPADRLAMPYSADPDEYSRARYGKTDANMQAAGGLVSTARDLSRWLEAQVNNGRVDGRQVLPVSAVAEAQRLQAHTDITSRGLRQVGYSLGWRLLLRGDDTLYSHGGGFTGFATLISFIPRRGVGVAVMVNEGELGAGLSDAITRSIFDLLLGPEPGASVPQDFAERVQAARQEIAADRARRAARPQTLAYPLEAYAGVYEDPSLGTIELRIVNGRLEATAGAAWSAVEVYDAERNQLRIALTGSGSVATVEMDAGRAAALTMLGRRFTRR